MYLRICPRLFWFRMAASVILSIAYGIDVQSADDPFVLTAEKALETVAIAGHPGSFLIDTFPLRAFSYST